MINQNRIVPITAIDLLTAYGTMLNIGGVSATPVSTNNPGVFEIAEGGTQIANEPVQSVNFADGVTSAVLYFVAGYDYKGFTVNGTAVTTTGDGVKGDDTTLYTATLADGGVTIAKISM